MTTPWDSESLWLKAKMFVNRAMDEGREFEEQAFWAAAALELLGKAALARISPVLIANPDDDGKSILIATGAIEFSDAFSSVQAKAIWSRCARAFRTFDEIEAKKVASGRNEYIHSTGLGFDKIPQALWWPRFWAQAFILIHHLDETITNFVGVERADEVDEHLATNKKYVERRLATLLERAVTLLSRHRAGSLTTKQDAEWVRFGHRYYKYSTAQFCPACKAEGRVGGDEVTEVKIEYPSYYNSDPEDQFDDPRSITLDVALAEFWCPTCHLVLNEPALFAEVGFDETFEVEGDPDDYEDVPEYENE